MLFKYGLTSDINKNGYDSIITEQEDEEEKMKWKKYNYLSRIALALIIVGFLFQILSTLLSR